MQPAPIEFLADGQRIRGRFYHSSGSPLYTLVLVPGLPGDPDDVLGLGSVLSTQGINVMMFNPPGFHKSEGVWTFQSTLTGIGCALEWLGQPDIGARLGVTANRLALGGYSYGGGLASAYAAQDPRVRRLVSIAGNDHAEQWRRLTKAPAFFEGFKSWLFSLRAPAGPIAFDSGWFESGTELEIHPETYDLRENARSLHDRSILLIGGWDDDAVSVEGVLLPFYRALKQAHASDVTFVVYHDSHEFARTRSQLACDIRDWLLQSSFKGP